MRPSPLNPTWQGEAHYLQRDYTAATGAYAAFQSYQASANITPMGCMQGYALFQRGLYLDALSAFRSYLKTTEQADCPNEPMQAPSSRCYYATRSSNRPQYYGEVIAESKKDEAYARFNGRVFWHPQPAEAQIQVTALVATEPNHPPRPSTRSGARKSKQ